MARRKNVGLLVGTTAGWHECAACLTWQPGVREPTAIAARDSADSVEKFEGRGESLLGCFAAFLVAESHDTGVQMIEDGFVIYLARRRQTN